MKKEKEENVQIELLYIVCNTEEHNIILYTFCHWSHSASRLV